MFWEDRIGVEYELNEGKSEERKEEHMKHDLTHLQSRQNHHQCTCFFFAHHNFIPERITTT